MPIHEQHFDNCASDFESIDIDKARAQLVFDEIVQSFFAYMSLGSDGGCSNAGREYFQLRNVLGDGFELAYLFGSDAPSGFSPPGCACEIPITELNAFMGNLVRQRCLVVTGVVGGQLGETTVCIMRRCEQDRHLISLFGSILQACNTNKKH